MTTERAFWRIVESEFGGPLSTSERAYCRGRGRFSSFLDADDGEERSECVADAVADIRCLRATGLTKGDDLELSDESPRDGRWELLRALHDRAHGGREPRAPLWVASSRAVGFYVGSGPRPLNEWVRVTFDRRLSFRSLVASLRKLWPELRKQGAVRQTRPFDPRTIELLRFVCLEVPDRSWRERWEQWNATQQVKWRIPTPRAFTSVFHRAERSLTGVPHGLEWFYEPRARLTVDELRALVERGDARARALEQRRHSEGLASISEAGIGVVHQ